MRSGFRGQMFPHLLAGGRCMLEDETLVEPFAVQEYFVDGFADFHVENGVLRAVGYRTQPASRMNGDPLKIVIFRVAIPVNGAGDAAMRTQEILTSSPVQSIGMIPKGKVFS